MNNDNHFIFRALGLSPEKLVGYVYAGLLSTFCLTIVDPQYTKLLLDSLGSFLLTFVALGIGVGIYTFYFHVLGNLLLYPVQHLTHQLWNRMRRRVRYQQTSTIGYLGYLGVPLGLRRAAYESIKVSLFKSEEKKQIQLAHGELHVLYLSAVELSITAIYLWFTQSNISIILVSCAVVSYAGALISDTHQHSQECHIMRVYGTSKLKKFLIAGGYIPKRPIESVSISPTQRQA